MASGNHVLNFPEPPYPQRFQPELAQSFIDMTLRKVRDYRPTIGLGAEWDVEGPHHKNITSVADYWKNEYDWKSVENEMNMEFEHYVTTVPGSGDYTESIPLHFVHHPSKNSDAVPLLLLHGWPSSFLEWSKVIKPLSSSFHIVAPDLPGFGFSPAPKQAGLGPREMGRAFDALMHQLGYDRYGIVTTDLGWFTGMWMVHDVHDSILGHMTDFFIVPASAEDQARLEKGEATSEEAAYMKSLNAWYSLHWGYATLHGQKPLALALALNDSPVGLLGWYWDVNYATSDGYAYSPKQLITDAMMLWIPGPYANIRAYREVFNPAVANFPETDVPTGVSQWSWANGPFPDIGAFAFCPKEWIERATNLAFFSRHNSGGHFPAVSEPDLWLKDVQAFFRSIEDGHLRQKDEL